MSTLPIVTFGALLRRYRLAAGLSQEDLAERAHLSREAISTLERGTRRAPRRETLELLADALGLAPADRARLQQVARGQVAPAATTAIVHSLSVAREVLLPLAGRRQELARLAQHLAGVGPPLLLFAGEPGIGKSRLLAEATQHARAQGWTVLEGGCHRRSGQEPYAPLLTALESSLRRSAPAALRAQLEGCAWLVRLLPELAETTLVPAPSWSLPPEQERRLMFAAVARYLANVTGPAGTLLVLDDLQWAGADALDLLAHLLRAPGKQSLRVVAAYRSTEVRPPDPLRTLLADLSAAGLAGEIRLGPLAPEEASALLQSVLEERAGADTALRMQLVERTGGVPYFLVSCAQALWVGAEVRHPAEALPWNVTQSIGQRVAALPQTAQELLGAAAVVGREAPGALLLAVAAQPQEEVVAALEALDRARLLVEKSEASYQFPHDLIREVVLADLSALRRRQWHAQVTEALEQIPQRQREGRASELAWHWQEAGDARRALPYALLAGDQAEAVYAHLEAERHYQTACNLAQDLGDQQREAEALEKLGLALRFLARFPQALETLEGALALYQEFGDMEGQGRVLARLIHLHVFVGTREEGLARVQPLVAPLCAVGLPLSGQAALYTALSRLYLNLDQYPEALSAASQAEALAEQAQDDHLLGLAKARRGVALQSLEREEEAAQVLEDATRLLEASGDLEALGTALSGMNWLYRARGEYTLALAGTERSLAIAERRGDLEGRATHQQRRGGLFFTLGHWEQARQDFEQVATDLAEERLPGLRAASHLYLGYLLLVQGQAEAAAAHFQRGLALAERADTPDRLFEAACVVAYQDLLEGRPQAAQARLEPLLEGSAPEAGFRLWVQGLLGWAYVAVGNLERAEALLAEALSLARVHHLPWSVVGVLHSQARLALRQERWQEAEQALAEALALTQARHTPYDEAQTLYLSGLLHSQQGDTESARERLEAALALCGQLGERLYARQIEQALAHLGHQEWRGSS